MTRSNHPILPPESQRGSAAILFALFLTVVLGCAALAVDLTRLHLVKVELQNAADAAALAGAQSLYDSEPYPDWVSARATALEIAHRNFANAARIQDASIETGYWNLDTPSLGFRTTGLPVGGDVPAVRVTISISTTANNGPVKFFFAPFLGIDESDMQASAIAMRSAAGGGKGFFPWAISNCAIQEFWDYENNRPKVDENGDPLAIDLSIESVYHDDCISGTWTTFWDEDNSVPQVRHLIDHGNPLTMNIGDSTWIQAGVKDALFKYDGIKIGEPVPVLIVASADNLSIEVNTYQTILAIAALTIDEIVKINGKSHIIGHLSEHMDSDLDPGTGPYVGSLSRAVLIR